MCCRSVSRPWRASSRRSRRTRRSSRTPSCACGAGRTLRAQLVQVRVGDSLLDPVSVDDRELVVDLTAIPTAKKRAGVTGLQAVHDVLMGTPETAHHGSESNLVAFVLRPSLSAI